MSETSNQSARPVTSPEANRCATTMEPPRQSANKLISAYVKAWAEMDVVRRDAENPHFGSNYATLEATMRVVKPVFARHGLALMQIPSEIDAAGNLVITGVLAHESGESITFRTMVPVGRDLTPQKMGSATTYGLRYQLQAVAGVAPADDDGEAASALPKPAAKPQAAKPAGASRPRPPFQGQKP